MALPHVEINGNVQRIESRQANGKNITQVSISCGDKKKDGQYDNFYIDATFWEQTADFVAKNYREGSAIGVRGELMTTSYEKEGRKIYKTDLRFPRVVFLPRDRDAQQSQQAPQQGYNHSGNQMNQPARHETQQQPAQVPEIDINEDEIPF